MPFQPINFLNAPLAKSRGEGLLKSLMEGYRASQEPKNTRLDQSRAMLDNAFKQLKNEQEPIEFKNRQRESELTQQQQMMKNALDEKYGDEREQSKLERLKEGDLTGLASEAAGIERLKRLGNPAYKRAEKAYDIRTALQESNINYKGSLVSTANKRASSLLAKLKAEKQEVEDGFLPGSGGTIPISPEEQTVTLGQYDKQIHKATTFANAAERSLLASNMEKTIKRINVDDLVRYSGIPGGLKKISEESKAPFNKQSKEYKSYTNALVGAETLATQVRAFYKDSIQPSMLARLEKLVNPSSWLKSPELAKANYQAIVDILNAEGATYSNANKNASEYIGQKPEGKYTPQQEFSRVYFTDKNGNKIAKMVPNDRLDEILQKGGSLNG